MKFAFQIVLCLCLFACGNKEEIIINPPSDERGYLVSYNKTGSMTADRIIAINQAEGDVSNYVNYTIDIYSVTYNSLENENPIEVSGLVLVPQIKSGAVDLIQYHHGTIIPGDEGTPSNYSGGATESIEMYFLGATMASNGYIVAFPDYVGYGVTADREHPYTMHHELAEVSVDLIRATKQLMTTLDIEFSNNAFSTGWSEGGGAGLAMHKYLQEKYSNVANIKASSLFAGPYDYAAFFKDVFVNPKLQTENMSIYNWSLYSLNNLDRELSRPASDIWTYPVANQIDALDIPSFQASDLFKKDFIESEVNNPNSGFSKAVQDNSLIEGWIPQGYLFFHSGTEDFIVPHYNSTNAHEYFKAINVNSTLYEYVGDDHYTPVYDYLTKTLDDFNSL
ncbi:MAG: hypothetical protein AAF960_29570 [Bacteroidota bacterium]